MYFEMYQLVLLMSFFGGALWYVQQSFGAKAYLAGFEHGVDSVASTTIEQQTGIVLAQLEAQGIIRLEVDEDGVERIYSGDKYEA